MKWANYTAALLVAVIVLNAFQMLRERPLVYVEGTRIDAAHRPTSFRFRPFCARFSPAGPAGWC